jgi:hypothetical protein
MQSFWEWIVVVAPNLWLPLLEGDVGRSAFIASQNRSFKDFLKELLLAQKITDPRLVEEAKALIADQDNHLFNYGEELLKIASSGRGRMTGGDILQAATEAAGRLWERLWSLDAYPGGQTWESRFPQSAQRGGIRGTVRAFANHLLGHFAQRLRKSRSGVSTVQQSQLDSPIDPATRAANPADEWNEWKLAIRSELLQDLRTEEERGQGGKHAEARIRNIRWALQIAEKLMVFPYQRRSLPEVMAEIPELRGVARGGLQQTLKNLIDDARMRVVAKMGSAREQAVAHWLQKRRRRSLRQTEGRCLPSLWA